MILLIMGCSLIGTVLLIGVCSPLSVANIPVPPPRDDPPSIVIEEPFRGRWHFNANQEDGASYESTREDAIRADLREWVASRSIPILRSRGMTDGEIKSELLRDFALTEEQIDEMLAAQ